MISSKPSPPKILLLEIKVRLREPINIRDIMNSIGEVKRVGHSSAGVHALVGLEERVVLPDEVEGRGGCGGGHAGWKDSGENVIAH